MKRRLLQTVLFSLSLVLLLSSVIIIIKPGASIFFRQWRIDSSLFTRENEFLVYYPKQNPGFWNYQTLLISENGQILTGIPSERAGNKDDWINGTYQILTDKNTGEVKVLIYPTQTENGSAEFGVLFRPYLFSPQWGNFCLLIFAGGVFLFIYQSVAKRRKKNFQSGSAESTSALSGEMTAADIIHAKQRHSIQAGSRFCITGFFADTVPNTMLAVYAYVFMEWIFFVTKPSFMNILSLMEKIQVLLQSVFFIGLAVIFLLLLVLLFELTLLKVSPGIFSSVYPIANGMLLSFVVACLCILLIDNFTYTIFTFGIVSSQSFGRTLYALLFLLIGLISIMAYQKKERQKSDFKILSVKNGFTAGLFALSFIMVLAGYHPAVRADEDTTAAGIMEQPNIILLSSDGVNASSMSVYGYENDTTPFIRELAETSLVCKNNFTNASTSLGSETAILTGKNSINTGTIVYSNMLRGNDMYEHLPGLLRRLGYYTVSLNVPNYTDPDTVNLQNGFDSVNGKSQTKSDSWQVLTENGYPDSSYFLMSVLDRISERLKQIFFIADMVNPVDFVAGTPSQNLFDDEDRYKHMISALDYSSQNNVPVFIHVHNMITHGDTYYPKNRVFSEGLTQDQQYMTAFYNDAILDFDDTVRSLVSYLKETGQYDNTILILYTDHGRGWSTLERLPLIIHFPDNENAGIIEENTQNIDIAPTILDYLGVDIPSWMEGSSLLTAIDPSRLILIARHIVPYFDSENNAITPESQMLPPLSSYGGLDIVQCQNIYAFDFVDLSFSEGKWEDYPNPCPEERLLNSRDAVISAVSKLFASYGIQFYQGW